MDKITLTLDEILDKYFLKDWVQDELRGVGLPTSGNKDELIDRFLDSKVVRRSSVDELGTRLVETLRVTELRQIAENVGSETRGGRDQILRGILDSVVFEPFVKHTRRHCKVCSRERRNELHFGVDWQADHFICEVCGSRSPVRGASARNDSVKEAEAPIPLQVTDVRHDQVSHRGAALAIVLSAVCMFLAVTIPMTTVYGWAAGILSGLVFTFVAGFLLIRTQKLWEPWLLRRIQ